MTYGMNDAVTAAIICHIGAETDADLAHYFENAAAAEAAAREIEDVNDADAARFVVFSV